MIYVFGPKDIPPKDMVIINTTSSSTNFGKGLSPFILGPCELYDGMISMNMENAWQFSKVYPKHVDENGEPTIHYRMWAKKGWSDGYAHRYPMGKNAKPLYSLWDGEKLDYIEARKKIYIPLYRDAVKDRLAFKKLKNLYEIHGTIGLWDYDGYNYKEKGMTLEEVVNNPKLKMGHAFVLAMMLEGKL